MTSAESEAVGTFFDRVMNAGDLSALDSIVRRDAVVPQAGGGLEGVRELVSGLRRSFSDPEYRIMETVSDGHRFSVRFSGTATNSGKYLGVPPTDRRLNLWGLMMLGFEAGAIAELWVLLDAEAILKQLRGP